jgi:hypothetical protein
MAERNDDLWPDAVFKGLGIMAPVVILREQAAALTTRSRGAVIGNVDSKTSGVNVVHDLDIAVPSLEYIVTLVRVTHTVTRLYPARVTVVAGQPPSTTAMASNDLVLRAALKKAFATERVTRLLGTLFAQVQSV